MKFAAFISIIVSVAVIFAACQGAVGQQGETGAKGDKGDTGDTGAVGPQGPPGAAALTLKQDVDTTVAINDGEDQQGNAIVGSSSATREMSSFFAGGTTSVTYSASAPATFDADGDPNTDAVANQVEVSDDGTTVTIKLKTAATQVNPAMGYPVEVMAKDEMQGVTFTQKLRVVRNSAPVTAGSTDIANLVIGTQGAKPLAGSGWPGDTASCDMMNSCDITLMVGADATASGVHFGDYGKLTYSVESSDEDKVTATGGNKVTITGVASTAVTAAGTTSNTFADQGVTITVTAMDAGMLRSAKKSFMVIVKKAPTRNNVAIPDVTLEEGGTNGARTVDTTLFYSGGTGTLAYSLIDDDATHPNVRAAMDGSTGVLTLTATPNGLNGDREVKFRVAEDTGAAANSEGSSVGQYLDMSIMVTNASN